MYAAWRAFKMDERFTNPAERVSYGLRSVFRMSGIPNRCGYRSSNLWSLRRKCHELVATVRIFDFSVKTVRMFMTNNGLGHRHLWSMMIWCVKFERNLNRRFAITSLLVDFPSNFSFSSSWNCVWKTEFSNFAKMTRWKKLLHQSQAASFYDDGTLVSRVMTSV